MENDYVQGQIDIIRKFGECCNSTVCDECPLNIPAVGCQTLAMNQPKKFISILESALGEDWSFYNEYCLRMPESNLKLSELAQISCRKVMFADYYTCEHLGVNQAECEKCWGMPYEKTLYEGEPDEVAEENSEIEDYSDNTKAMKFCTKCGKELGTGDVFCTHCGNHT